MADAIAGSAVLKQELAVVGEELHRARAGQAPPSTARSVARRVRAGARARLGR